MQRRPWLVSTVAAVWVVLAGCAAQKAPQTAEEIPYAPADVRPAMIGSRVPDVTLWTPEGNHAELREVVAEQPTVLMVYRGDWCAYCKKHLQQLAGIESQLQELGYQIVAISPDRPETMRKTVEDTGLGYRLLSDPHLDAAQWLGLAYYVDEATRRSLERYGADLRSGPGQPHKMLPVPAVFLVDRHGVIRFDYVNPDYRVRLDPDVLLAAARALQGSS